MGEEPFRLKMHCVLCASSEAPLWGDKLGCEQRKGNFEC